MSWRGTRGGVTLSSKSSAGPAAPALGKLDAMPGSDIWLGASHVRLDLRSRREGPAMVTLHARESNTCRSPTIDHSGGCPQRDTLRRQLRRRCSLAASCGRGYRMTQRFMVKRDDLRKVRVVSGPEIALAAGQARLRVDAFSLTSNNITYGAFGESMHYWDFFPTGEAGWGCIPVWGFADVVESRRRGRRGRGALLRLLADGRLRSAATGARRRARLRRRRAAPSGFARALQPLYALQRRHRLSARARGSDCAAAAAVRDVIPDRRLRCPE